MRELDASEAFPDWRKYGDTPKVANICDRGLGSSNPVNR